ncbi:acetate--CoA ligase [Candidatus Igneacidithiobacillus taiwanensis]|uniref:acetate--CoA ligase n=1 Tax=Candidatus Igneacidithiobacillus taiwanensis TaxID=1945924 RepID=UPI002897741A|nr:acetate--CoA ligase [Candidatus Igneacidithiobacillus taiwanensis]MCE5361150.1 acetate--CoA ligase [Acidithiobacillus sp.]
MTSSIDSHLSEERSFPVPEAFAAHANIDASEYRRLQALAEKDPEKFWGDLARQHLAWDQPFSEVLDAREAPFYRWFADGTLNVCANCIDRHLQGAQKHKAALIWEGEDGSVRTLTYAQLHREVGRFANTLLAQGIAAGDRVVLYLPMVIEAVVAMLACARIGAIHSVVFAGFSAEALKDRLEDTGAKILVTADSAVRAGKLIPLKRHADQALTRLHEQTVQRVIVLRRGNTDADMEDGRDIWWHDAVQDQSCHCAAPAFAAEHPLFILYTSGSTGKPKGILHSSAGYLLWSKLTSLWSFDIQPDDVYWCTADIGWITGHSYVVYGPLANGATVFLYEGAPMYPQPDRFWSMIERHGVSILYTAPTAVRAFMKMGDSWVKKHDLRSLRLLGSVGEPLNPEAWVWYREVIGSGRAPIVDTWWQTETGGHMIAPLPGVTANKPGSCALPLPGISATVVDEAGVEIREPNQGGYLVIDRPWPGMLRGVWGNPERYVQTYWSKFANRYYVAGDSARRDSDGYFWVMGRIDDVLNVSGHRLGTAEIESALVAHAAVAEAAVVGVPHEIKGEAVSAFVVLKAAYQGEDHDQLGAALRAQVTDLIGAIARPDDIHFVDGLPKTRSGKIMRRLLRARARGEEIDQDTSTLED